MSKIEITPELLADLTAKAEKATPGPWEQHEHYPFAIIDYVLNTICEIGKGSVYQDCEANAEYIAAANPSVILALIENYENKKEALYGMFLLVNQLKGCMNLDKDASVEETIKRAVDLIGDLEQSVAKLQEEAYRLASSIAELSCPHECPHERRLLLNEGTLCWRKAAQEEIKGSIER